MVEIRREYYFVPGPYYKNESYEGSPVKGRFVHDEFTPRRILWWEPRYTITSAYVAKLKNGKFAVRRQGMNYAWKDINSTDAVFEDFQSACHLLESRVDLANRANILNSVENFIIEFLIVSFFLGIIVLGIYKYV